MPIKQRVYRNNPQGQDHGKPMTAFAVDARELIASGEYTRNPPKGTEEVVEETKPAVDLNPEGTDDGQGSDIDPPDEADAVIGQLKRDQLVELAQVYNISNCKTMNKPDLVQALIAAEEHNPSLIAKRKGYIQGISTE